MLPRESGNQSDRRRPLLHAEWLRWSLPLQPVTVVPTGQQINKCQKAFRIGLALVISGPVPDLTGHGNFCGAAKSMISGDLSDHDVNNGRVRVEFKSFVQMSAESDPGALVSPKIWGSTRSFINPSLPVCWILCPILLSFCFSLLFAGLLGRQRSF